MMEEEHDDASLPLANELPAPSWIKNGIILFVLDGLKSVPYPAVTKSNPFFSDGEWHVTIKYETSCETKDVECSRCIQLEEQGRPSRETKKRMLYSPNHSSTSRKKQKKVKVEPKQSGGWQQKYHWPPAIIDLSGGNDDSSSPSSDLSSEGATPLSGVARMSPPEEESSDEDDRPVHGNGFVSPGPKKKKGPGRPKKYPLSDRHYGKSSTTNKKGPGRPKKQRPSQHEAPSSRRAYVPQISDESLLTDGSSKVDSERSKKPTAAQRKQEEAKREKCKEQFEAAEKALSNFSYTTEEIKAALEEIGPPFTKLQTAAAEIQRKQKEIANGEEQDGRRGRIEPEIGMQIRKSFDGTVYKGIVVAEEEVIKNGKRVMVWIVVYEDGDQEDLEIDELMRYRYPKPDMAKCRGRPMQALELFCGRGVVSQEFRQRLWKVVSLDIDENSNATLCKDILEVEPCDLPFVPDFIWASPPCHTYSFLAGGAHRSARHGKYEKTEEACRNNFLFTKMVRFMKQARSLHPHLIVVIENPVGQLQKMPLMKAFVKEFGLQKVQVDYCAFGRSDKKPTHIWTNDIGLSNTLRDFRCEDRCFVGGNRKGNHDCVQGNGHIIDFGVIPQPLAEEVAERVNSKFNLDMIRRTKAADPRRLPREAAIGGSGSVSIVPEGAEASEIEEQNVDSAKGLHLAEATQTAERKRQESERSDEEDTTEGSTDLI